MLEGSYSAGPSVKMDHLADKVQCQLPSGDARSEKAARRLQATSRRRKLQAPQTVLALDFTLQEGTWCGVDGQPVPILDKLEHESKGVILLDGSVATAEELRLMRSMGSEALSAVIVGHQCPEHHRVLVGSRCRSLTARPGTSTCLRVAITRSV